MSEIRTLPCTLLAIWALSFFFVNGSFIPSNAGSCSSNEFWDEPTRNCVPLGNSSFDSIPPPGTSCPSKGCPSQHVWDTTACRCIRASHAQHSIACGSTEFWFSESATCVPRRDFNPPSTARCPSGWYWSTQMMSCAPANPEALSSPLTCGNDSVWSPSRLICERVTVPSSRRSLVNTPSRRPSPSPSAGQPSRRQKLKSRSSDLCPTGLDACPILKVDDLSDYECVDPKYDLEHCGGCSIDGRGKDCTSIEGVWNVECTRARCSVGYVPSIDQRGCLKL